jgi:hypothetical protein
MPRRNPIPAYRLHKQSGQAIVTLPDGLGGRRDFILGEYGSSESQAEYARLLAEWEASGRCLPRPSATTDISVNELIVGFWTQVEAHYRHPDGTPTSEQKDFSFPSAP